MTSSTSDIAVHIRPFDYSDKQSVLELLNASLGGGPTGEHSDIFFRWKHLANPFGESLMLVAEVGGRIVGFRSFMRWRFLSGETTYQAVRAVDTATHPDLQGHGIFSRLTLAAVGELRGETDLIFNTPNDKSLPGYLKMGWRTVGRVPVSVRVRHPVKVARGIRRFQDHESHIHVPLPTAPTADEVLRESEVVSQLLGVVEPANPLLATPIDLPFLKWRYGDAPGLDYRAVVAEERGVAKGIAFFRVRARGCLVEASLSDLIVGRGDVRTAARLLRMVSASAPVDHVAAVFTPGSEGAAAATRCGFLRLRSTVTLVVNPLGDGLTPDPAVRSSWALSLGDLEVF